MQGRMPGRTLVPSTMHQQGIAAHHSPSVLLRTGISAHVAVIMCCWRLAQQPRSLRRASQVHPLHLDSGSDQLRSR